MQKTTENLPIWIQNDLEQQLIRDETVNIVSILTNYPLSIKKTYLTVTDKRLIGTEKKWFSTRRIDVPLKDITRVQVNSSIKIGKIMKTIFWGFLSVFLFVFIIPVVLAILNFLSIFEKDLEWIIKGYGPDSIGGKRTSLEVVQRAIRENQNI